jgi:hypothetical protein
MLAAALALLAATAPSPPGPTLPGGDGTGCSPRGSGTVAANRVARVFSVSAGDASFVYGCVRASGRRTLLGVAGGIAGAPGPGVRLAGTTVAVITAPRIRTRSLRTGRTLRIARVGASVGRVLLRRDGTFAAVGAGRVIKVDGDGRTIADRGPGIEGRSLRRAGDLLRWRSRGVARAVRWWSGPAPGCRRGRVVAQSGEILVVDRHGLAVACPRTARARGLRLLAGSRWSAAADGGVVALAADTTSCRIVGWDVTARTLLAATDTGEPAGACVDAGSLHVSGTAASWTRAGAPMSIDLARVP